MTYPIDLREEAIDLRRCEGLSIDEIASRLKVSRSTVYRWVGEVPIDRDRRSEKWRENQNRGTVAMQRKYRRIREHAYRQGCEEFADRAADATFRDFVCMYIGEGYKRDRNCVALANSDPRVVSLASALIARESRNPARYDLQYHRDQDPEWLRRFWGFRLGVPPQTIHLQRKSNSGRLAGRKWRSRYGVMTVRAGDTQLRARLQAWMDLVQAQW